MSKNHQETDSIFFFFTKRLVHFKTTYFLLAQWIKRKKKIETSTVYNPQNKETRCHPEWKWSSKDPFHSLIADFSDQGGGGMAVPQEILRGRSDRTLLHNHLFYYHDSYWGISCPEIQEPYVLSSSTVRALHSLQERQIGVLLSWSTYLTLL